MVQLYGGNARRLGRAAARIGAVSTIEVRRIEEGDLSAVVAGIPSRAPERYRTSWSCRVAAGSSSSSGGWMTHRSGSSASACMKTALPKCSPSPGLRDGERSLRRGAVPSARIFTIAIVAPERRFDQVAEAGAPIMDSFEFHAG